MLERSIAKEKREAKLRVKLSFLLIFVAKLRFTLFASLRSGIFITEKMVLFSFLVKKICRWIKSNKNLMRWSEKDKLDLFSKEKWWQGMSWFFRRIGNSIKHFFFFWEWYIIILRLKIVTLLFWWSSDNGCRTDGRTETIDSSLQSSRRAFSSVIFSYYGFRWVFCNVFWKSR